MLVAVVQYATYLIIASLRLRVCGNYEYTCIDRSPNEACCTWGTCSTSSCRSQQILPSWATDLLIWFIGLPGARHPAGGQNDPPPHHILGVMLAMHTAIKGYIPHHQPDLEQNRNVYSKMYTIRISQDVSNKSET